MFTKRERGGKMYGLIFRQRSTDEGTEGMLSIPEVGFSCFSLELPWRQNLQNLSCIPQGDYDAIPINSAKFGHVYLLQDVPGRGGILTHSGNYAGDVQRGFKTHSRGCLLFGKMRGSLAGQTAILYSRPTLYQIMKLTANKPLKIIIRGIV